MLNYQIDLRPPVRTLGIDHWFLLKQPRWYRKASLCVLHALYTWCNLRHYHPHIPFTGPGFWSTADDVAHLSCVSRQWVTFKRVGALRGPNLAYPILPAGYLIV